MSDDGYVYNKEKFKKYISAESYLDQFNKKEMDYIITKIKEEYKVKENELEIVNKRNLDKKELFKYTNSFKEKLSKIQNVEYSILEFMNLSKEYLTKLPYSSIDIKFKTNKEKMISQNLLKGNLTEIYMKLYKFLDKINSIEFYTKSFNDKNYKIGVLSKLIFDKYKRNVSLCIYNLEDTSKHYNILNLDKGIKELNRDIIKLKEKIKVEVKKGIKEELTEKEMLDFIKFREVYKMVYENLITQLSFLQCDLIPGYEISSREIKRIELSQSLGAYSVKRAVCMSYSEIISYVLNELGIDTKIIRGYLVIGENSPSNHSWIKVKIGEKWYVVDYMSDGNFLEERLDLEWTLISDKLVNKNLIPYKDGINDVKHKENKALDIFNQEIVHKYINIEYLESDSKKIKEKIQLETKEKQYISKNLILNYEKNIVKLRVEDFKDEYIPEKYQNRMIDLLIDEKGLEEINKENSKNIKKGILYNVLENKEWIKYVYIKLDNLNNYKKETHQVIKKLIKGIDINLNKEYLVYDITNLNYIKNIEQVDEYISNKN